MNLCDKFQRYVLREGGRKEDEGRKMKEGRKEGGQER
jgi:hypothetical protein